MKPYEEAVNYDFQAKRPGKRRGRKPGLLQHNIDALFCYIQKHGGVCHESNEELASELGLSQSTVSRYVSALASTGKAKVDVYRRGPAFGTSRKITLLDE